MKNFFKSAAFAHVVTIIGSLGNLASYIQAYKIFLLQSAYAVSLLAVFISLVSMIVWLIYGLARNIKPLIYANIFGIIGTLLVATGIFYYHD